MPYDPATYTVDSYKEWETAILALPLGVEFKDAAGRRFVLTSDSNNTNTWRFGYVFCIDTGTTIHLSEISEAPCT